MQVRRILDEKWYLINSAEKSILVSKNFPNEHEKLSFRMDQNQKSTEPSSIYLYSQPSHDYIYIFQNQPFKISGINDVLIFNLSDDENIEFQLLVGSDETKFYFYAFKFQKANNSQEDSLQCTLLGTIDKSLLPFADEWSWKNKLKFYYDNGYYYLDCSFLFFGFSTHVMEDFAFFRFNSEKLETFIAHKGDFINFSGKAKPETIITQNGIFDIHSFELFDITHLIEELPRVHTAYYYKVFTISQKKKLLFVSETHVNFSNMHTANRPYKTAFGLLYDLSEKCYILPHTKEPFYEFLLYDYGLPHVFFTHVSNKQYLNIISLNSRTNKFSKTSYTSISLAFSVFDNTTSRKKSILFVQSKSKIKDSKKDVKEELMLHFDEQLHLVASEPFAQFHSLITIEPSNRFDTCDCNGKKTPYIANEKSNFPKEHSFVSDAASTLGLIITSLKGEFGEYVYLPILDNTCIDYNTSFWSYQIFTLTSSENISTTSKKHYLKAICKRNDFENYTYIISLDPGYPRCDDSTIHSLASSI